MTGDHKHLNLEPAQEHDLDQLPRDQQPQNQPDQDPYQDQVEQQQQLQRMLLAQQEMEHLRWEEQRRWEAERRLQEDTSASAKLYRFACALAEIALRVPPLFLLDELFKVSLGLYYSAQPGEVNTTSAAATAAAKSSYMYMTGVLGSPPLLYNESATVAESLALEDDELMDAYFIKAAFVIIPRVLLCITGIAFHFYYLKTIIDHRYKTLENFDTML